MVRDAITVTSSVRAGVEPATTLPDADNGRMANAAGRTIFVYVNGLGGASAQATQVTIQQVADPYNRIQNDLAFNVPVNVVGTFGPFPPLLYNQTSGEVHIDYDLLGANAAVFGLAITGG